MATDIEIKAAYEELLGREPTPAEISRWAYASNFAMEQWIKAQPEYANSIDYRTRYAQIAATARSFWGMDLQPQNIDHYVRSGATDEMILEAWRGTEQYKRQFWGKPDYMTETEYYKLKDKQALKGDEIQDIFNTYANWSGSIGEPEVTKIILGGPGTEKLRAAYAQALKNKASADALRGHSFGGKVKETPLGPVQPTMRGMRVHDTAQLPAQPQPGTTASLSTDVFNQSYQDFKEGVAKNREAINPQPLV